MGFFSRIFSRWSTLAWAYAYPATVIGIQRATYLGGHSVRHYGSVADMSVALQHVTYREDTLGSLVDSLTGTPACVGDVAKLALRLPGMPGVAKIDFLRHPSQMQAGIDQGTVEATAAVGDCEDYCGWIAAALMRSGLGKNIDLVYVAYERAGQTVAHMVCRYIGTGGAGGIGPDVGVNFWMSNWNKCVPLVGDAIGGVEYRVKAPVKEAVAWSVSLGHDDTILLGAPRILRTS